MLPLHGQSGRVAAWLDTDSGRIYSLKGDNLAFVSGDGVYNYRGQHIAWWQDGHIRDRTGAAAYFTPAAENLGVVRPVRAVRPVRPVRKVAPVRPVKQVRPVKPVKRLAWSTALPF